MKKNIILIISFILSFECTLAQSIEAVSPITLAVKLKANEKISLILDGDKSMEISNKGSRDTTIFKNISSDKPMSFRYGKGYMKEAEFVSIFHTFYISPGDTAFLTRKDQYDIVATNSSNTSVFIDDWIKRKNFLKKMVFTDVSANGIIAYNLEVLQQFDKNNKAIDSLFEAKAINLNTKINWYIANELNYNLMLLEPISKLNFTKRPPQFDLVVEKILDRVLYFQQLQTDEIFELGAQLYKYDRLTKNKPNGNRIDGITFYVENSKKMGALATKKLENYLYFMTEKASPEYRLAIEKIRKYAEANDPILFNRLVDKGKFTFMNEVFVSDANGNKTSLYNIFNASKAQYFLIDMWASWCVPCRQQLPSFQKFKKEFQNKNIDFVSVSIDKEEGAWLTAIKEEKTDRQGNQFILVDYINSPLTKFFEIQTVPRYLVIDKQGNVVSDRFYLPTDEEFREAVVKILDK